MSDESEPNVPNRLANETSPYLLQHKDNPVDWYPWGQEALEKAKAEDKPILVSIGYSACHWCHVMEHESFEDAATAALMNARFVNIKVDREERPDIDTIYMTAVQAMTGHGGWPLNVFLTPEGVPFYGGTYWPPEDRQGMPAFQKVLQAVDEAYTERKDDVLQNAEQIREFLHRAGSASPVEGELDPGMLRDAVAGLSRQFDGEHGGFGGAPKFPQPSVLEFLLRHHRTTGDDRAARKVRLTLDQMAAGGVYDQIGGGFHRYAVDAVWLVPHFEKMLYDNAQLARVYLDAYRAFEEDDYGRVAREILDYVRREMTSPEGGFYATQDADSEGEEGKFYVWSIDEVDAVLGPDEGPIARAYFGMTERGNFEGRNIPHVPVPAYRIAGDLGFTEEQLTETVARVKERLYAARAKRVWPGRDEKVIAAWNGMMLRAFAEASRVFGSTAYRETAVKNAEFLTRTLLRDGKLLRVYKDGQARIAAFLEDYANIVDGLIALYEATFERRWLDEAVALAETMIAEFADEAGVGFFDTAASAEALVSRPRDVHDGATPSGNAVAASVLLRLFHFTGRQAFEERALGVLRSMAEPMVQQPIGFGRLLSTVDAYVGTPREVAIVGRRGSPEVDAFAATVFGRYEPNAMLGFVDADDPTAAAGLPFLEDRPLRGGKTTAYLCEHFSCMPPVHEPGQLLAQLEAGTEIAWQEF